MARLHLRSKTSTIVSESSVTATRACHLSAKLAHVSSNLQPHHAPFLGGVGKVMTELQASGRCWACGQASIQHKQSSSAVVHPCQWLGSVATCVHRRSSIRIRFQLVQLATLSCASCTCTCCRLHGRQCVHSSSSLVVSHHKPARNGGSCATGAGHASSSIPHDQHPRGAGHSAGAHTPAVLAGDVMRMITMFECKNFR